MGSDANNNIEYTPLPTVNPTSSVNAVPSQVDQVLIARSARRVVFLCFIQLVMATLALLRGGLIAVGVSAIFISLGIVGAAKRRVRLVILHFIYSIVLYILSIVGLVLMFIYCHECKWWMYTVGFLFIVIQAIGLRSSKMLICLLKGGSGGNGACASRCGKSRWCRSTQTAQAANNTQQTQTTQASPVATPVSTQTAETNTPTAPQFVQQFPQQFSQQFPQQFNFPGQQMIAMPVQQGFPQYFPLQPIRYPMMQQPISVVPMMPQPQFNVPQNQQQQQMYPFVYKPQV